MLRHQLATWTCGLCLSVLFTSGCATNPAQLAARHTKATSGRSELQFGVARAREQEGDLTTALQTYEALYQSEPANAQVCHRLGVVKLRMGENTDGITYLMEADSLSPDNAEIKADLGFAHIQQGDFELAEQFLRDSLNLDPSNKLATNNLALAVGYQGRMSESFNIYKTVVDEAEAHANLGYICSQMGRTELAVQQYNRALDLNPTLKSAAEALVQISQLESQIASMKDPNETAEIQLTSGANEATKAN